LIYECVSKQWQQNKLIINKTIAVKDFQSILKKLIFINQIHFKWISFIKYYNHSNKLSINGCPFSGSNDKQILELREKVLN
jgi:hypothetical protein